MRYVDREKVEKVSTVTNMSEVSEVKEKWWRYENCVEIFPKNYVPIFFTNDKNTAMGIDDDDLLIMPKSGSWVKHKVEGYYILANVKQYNKVLKKYNTLRPKLWFEVKWNG